MSVLTDGLSSSGKPGVLADQRERRVRPGLVVAQIDDLEVLARRPTDSAQEPSVSLALRNLRQLPAHAEAVGIVADEAQGLLGVPGPHLEHARRFIRLLADAVGALVDLHDAEAPVHAEQEVQARQTAALKVHTRLALEAQARLLQQTGHAVLPAGPVHEALAGVDGLVERLLVAEGLRALRALERLLAEVHRLEVGPHDAGAREDLGALGARLAGHGLWHRCL